MNEDQRSQEWSALYAALSDLLPRFGNEDPYGKGDYWLVDDDWGDVAHKICVARQALMTAKLVRTIQNQLLGMPHWRVLIQVDEEVHGAPASSTGITVFYDRIESSADPRNGVRPEIGQ